MIKFPIHEKCHGFEAYLVEEVCKRIGLHYNISILLSFYLEDLVPHFYHTLLWKDIVPDLYNGKFDLILSGMGINGNWTFDNTTTIPREEILTFTCPYQQSEDGFVSGRREMPDDMPSEITRLDQLNRDDLIGSVETGTSMAKWLQTNLPNVFIILTVGGNKILWWC